jgi:predicted XRE-type DNA-binding protein
MAVDIVLTVNGKAPEYNEETSIRFDDENSNGDFWFLQPFFEKLRTKTSQVIDLYDDCVFENDNLRKLKQELVGEINTLKTESFEQKEIHTGTQIHPIKKEIYKPVIRKLLLDKLEKWLTITNLAIEKNEKLVGIGD